MRTWNALPSSPPAKRRVWEVGQQCLAHCWQRCQAVTGCILSADGIHTVNGSSTISIHQAECHLKLPLLLVRELGLDDLQRQRASSGRDHLITALWASA